MLEDNIAIVARWFDEVWNQRRAESIDELITADSVCETDEGPIRGPEEFKARHFVPFLAAFPDLHVHVESIVAQHDQVVVRWSATGTHAGDGLGCPPTHQPAQFRGITWVHVRDGKMMEGWQSSNIPEVLHRLVTSANP